MPNYTYTTGVPVGNQTPAQNRSPMTTNTNSINSILNVDLIGFNNSNGGFHQKSTYVDQGSDPVSASDQVVDYAKSVVYPNDFGTFSELFMLRDGNVTPIQLTAGPAAAGGTVAFGQSFLPGGFQLRFGTEGAGSGNVTYSSAPRSLSPFPNATICAFVIAVSSARSYNITAMTRTGFTFTSPSGFGANICWVAIGY